MMGRARISLVLLMVLITCKLGHPARSTGNGASGDSGSSDSSRPSPTGLGGSERGASILTGQSRQIRVRSDDGTKTPSNGAAAEGSPSVVARSVLTPAAPLVKGSTTPSTSVASQLDNGQRSSAAAVAASTGNLNDTALTITPSTPAKRRTVNRDNKLMSVLQARRSALTRDRWQKEYHSSSPYKFHRHSNPVVNLVEDSSTPESNLVIPPGSRIADTAADEFLDTDESIHGMYVVSPQNGKMALQHTGPQVKLAKETNNFVGQNSNKSGESTKLTSAKPFLARATFYEARGKRTRKNFPASTERSVEESDLAPYQYFGQKLIPPSRNADARNQLINTKGTRLTKLKEDSLEILTVSEPRPSTEKNKFWHNRLAYQSRNVVAFNNYLRRSKDGVYGTSTIAIPTEYSDHSDTLTNSMIALSNLSEGTADPKQIFSRSANNFTAQSKAERIVRSTTTTTTTTSTEAPATTTTTDVIPANHKSDEDLPGLFSPTGLAQISKLIINYPDDATPEDLYHHSVVEVAPNPTTVASEDDQPTTQPITEDYGTHRNLVSIPDINHIFQNLSTSTTTTTSTTESPVPITQMLLAETETIPASTEQLEPLRTTTTTSTTTEPTSDQTTSPQTEAATTTTTTESTTSTTTESTTTTTTTRQPTISSTATTPATTTTVTTTAIPASPDAETTPATEIYSDDVYQTDDDLPLQLANSTDTDGFNPILSHVFPKLSREPLPSRPPTIMDYSVTFTSPAPALDGTRKPTIAIEGVLLEHNTDVVIEMRKMNTATFILAGLGMLPIVIIILYVIKAAIWKREHKVSHDLERYIPDGQPPISPVVRLEQSDTSSVADESMDTDRDFNRKNLRFKSLLGEGNFGQVWKAEADDLAGHFGTTRIVAVKTERSDNGHGDLKAEAEIMRKLGSHPNVVTLLGVCLEQEPQLLIMEYAMRGRLLSLLRAARGAVNGLAPSIHSNRPPIMPLSPRRLTGFGHDIARGMEYIADKKIVHRDLAARNVLLDHNGICKICDFGMSIDLEKIKSSQAHIRVPRSHHSESRFKFDLSTRSFGFGRYHGHGHEGLGRHGHGRTHDTKSRPALPIRWMAPEALQYHIFSRETDVWAFGIVLWEIATLGCTPYPTLSGREVVRTVPNGARPEVPQDCRPELYDLMQRTWRKDPRQRPTFSEARTCLARTLCQWQLEETDTSNTSEYLDVSGFSEDLEQGMVYFNRRISEFECEI
ncbi:mucin-5AC isoform X2 [Toxorhynchites rutilus septentrionalis]|uniref:mucin-5AC isoform X2 n=1 Tax=Toxorhynchites rutilus septentrionalis TaxID=329112 RepID=UPI00247AA49A|nr:mucin-5AC isoform X2 [Toxorhynchites rutilus septentrionalis]